MFFLLYNNIINGSVITLTEYWGNEVTYITFCNREKEIIHPFQKLRKMI